ncbi:MAG: galactose-1-phosphate uridylyltransferase [bacterium]
MPELRKDPIIGRWIIIAVERAKRPKDFAEKTKSTPSSNSCPFCPGNEDKTPPEILALPENGRKPNTPGWTLRVVPNKFPALQIEGDLDREGIGMYDQMNGVGAHEVIIDSPDHNRTMAELSEAEVAQTIWAYKSRIIDLKRDPRFKYILIFKNEGEVAGASLRHPHSQLIATPIVPKRVKEKLRGSRTYFEYKERCVYCDIVRQEIRDEARIIDQDEHFLAFCPYASRFPFEVCIIPKQHKPHFDKINSEDMSSLPRILRGVLIRMRDVLDGPPYNYMLHTTPLSLPHDLEDYHWHIEIIPRLVNVAGFEWGSGFYINPTPPEEAAKYLREVSSQ